MDESYTYRNRPLRQQAMRELIPKLYAGQTKTRQEIVEGVERAHRKRGGTPTVDSSNRSPLVAAFKGAAPPYFPFGDSSWTNNSSRPICMPSATST